MPSIMDMFSHVKPQATPAPQPTPGNIPATPEATPKPGTGDVPANQDINKKPENPLDVHKDLWQPPTDKDGKPIPDTQPELFTGLTPQQLMEAAGKIDFTKSITAEESAAIIAGGEGAAKALATILNKTSQQVYAQSAFATSEIVKEAIKKSNEQNQATMEAKFKSFNLKEGLNADNPAFSHPAVAPIVKSVQDQLAIKFPNASTEELKNMSLQYVRDMATVLSPQPAKEGQQKKGNSKETDWSTFLESPSTN